jgi:hypothetical protein
MTAAGRPHTTVAIILGAKDFNLSGLQSDEAFASSAAAIRRYLLSHNGLALPEDNLLDLFDDPRGSADIDAEIDSFLEKRNQLLSLDDATISDVIVFYTGHGAFSQPGDDYFLTLRATRQSNPTGSGYRVVALAHILKERARSARRFILLDCCFAAAAYKAFQANSILDVAVAQSDIAFVKRGTSLLCASAPDRPAKSRTRAGVTETGMTLFSECLSEVLTNGIASVFRDKLTLAEIGGAVERLMFERYQGEGGRPQIKSPDERDGDVSKFPLFPNAAFLHCEGDAGDIAIGNDLAILFPTRPVRNNPSGSALRRYIKTGLRYLKIHIYMSIATSIFATSILVLISKVSGTDLLSKTKHGTATLSNGMDMPGQSVFSFATSQVGLWNQDLWDIGVSRRKQVGVLAFFLPYDAVPYRDPAGKSSRSHAGIKEVGIVSLSSIDACPGTGYSYHWLTPRIGTAYCVRTSDGENYAKILVTAVDELAGFVSFDWTFPVARCSDC